MYECFFFYVQVFFILYEVIIMKEKIVDILCGNNFKIFNLILILYYYKLIFYFVILGFVEISFD